MEVKYAKPFLLLLILSFKPQSIKCLWKRSQLTQCELHPDLELRIQRDVSFWGDKGISEDATLSVCHFCDPAPSADTAASDGGIGNGNGNGGNDGDHENGRRHNGRRHLQRFHQQQPGQEQDQQQHQKQRQRLLSGSENVGPACNKPQRILIRDGVVYLTNLVASDYLAPFEFIGFLVELYEASQVYRLPDVEFTYWFGDNAPADTVIKADGTTTWSYSSTGETPPILAWSKWNENAVLVVPYSGAYRCPSDSWDDLESQLESLASLPWSARKEVAFGRWNKFCTHYISWMKTADGELMKCPRSHLVMLAEAHPDLLDTYDLGRARPTPLAHQTMYKYIVSTDGWSISSKFDKYLLLGSAVLKAASTRFGFYYDAIKPYEHYVPFMVNSSNDILDVISWAKSHDSEVRRIAEAGRQFALQNLNRAARLCYLFRLLTELSKKMRFTPSCERRHLCVPLVRELRFLQSYPLTAQSCKYQEVLLRYGNEDPADLDPEFNAASRAAGVRSYYSLEELQRLHESGYAWPRDDLLLHVRQRV